jgi:hypothetical protein
LNPYEEKDGQSRRYRQSADAAEIRGHMAVYHRPVSPTAPIAA